jgi:hypothetical protein
MNATITLDDAEQFFYENAGYGVMTGESVEHAKARCAVNLAQAERHAQVKGWYVEWEIDQDADITPTDSYFVSGNPQWAAILYDENGDVLGSLWGIDFAEAYEVTYARVVAAELALEAL